MKAGVLFALLFFTLDCATLSYAMTIDTVPIRNPGNAPFRIASIAIGSIPYNYRIGKYEVTNAQYVEFLNSVDRTGENALGLYTNLMTIDPCGGIELRTDAANGSKYKIKPGRGNNPVVYVSWFDAVRFANWLHNRQGSGDTETGAYTLLGGVPNPSNGPGIARNPGARWWLPSEDEWYKAAYHKNDGVTANYWFYPTSSNAEPDSDQPPGNDSPVQSNTANLFENDEIADGYNDGFAVTGSPSFDNAQNYLTDVGAYEISISPYGTFDQGGNVDEWNETLYSPLSARGFHGGSWLSKLLLGPLNRRYWFPMFEVNDLGFRVATIVPEPTTLMLGVMARVGLLRRRR